MTTAPPRFDSTEAETGKTSPRRVPLRRTRKAPNQRSNRKLSRRRRRAPERSKNIELSVSEVTTESLATTLRAEVVSNKRAPYQVVFEIRRAGAEEWTAVATDRKAPFRRVIDLAGLELGTYEVRAVASAKGGARHASRALELTIPEPPANGSGEDGKETARDVAEQDATGDDETADRSWEEPTQPNDHGSEASPEAGAPVPTAERDSNGTSGAKEHKPKPREPEHRNGKDHSGRRKR